VDLEPASDPQITPSMPTLPELSPPENSAGNLNDPDHHTSAIPPNQPQAVPTRRPRRLPYQRIRKPLPARSHALYPNFTPARGIVAPDGEEPVPFKSDTRMQHEEIEDDVAGQLWSAGEAKWGGDGSTMAEWDPESGVRQRWVGPMVVIAQLHPCDRTDPHPPGVGASSPVEGPNVDLGPKGMYLSMGFEDLEVIMPWIELKGGGGSGGAARRPGLGFE